MEASAASINPKSISKNTNLLTNNLEKMHLDLVFHKINLLPYHVQEQLFQYVDFLSERYPTEQSEDLNGHSNGSDEYELTEEGRKFLEERIKKTEANPNGRKDWLIAMNKIHEKYNWPLIPAK
jgi:hypothetical protein